MIWNHKQDAALREIVERASILIPWASIAVEASQTIGMDLTEDQVRNRAKRLGVERHVPAPREPLFPKSIVEPVFNPAFAKVIESDDRRKVNARIRDEARFEHLLDIIRETIPTISAPILTPRDAERRGKGDQDMGLVISDTHYGQLVEPEVVGEGWAFDRDIFYERGGRLVNATGRIFKIQNEVDTIRRIHLFLLGDMVDGVDMRRGQGHRNDVNSAAQQAFQVAAWFNRYIEYLTTLADVTVHAAYGNHGRVGEFGVNLPMDNWDYVAYNAMEAAFQSNPHVDFVVPTEKYGIEEILGQNIYYAHGDAIGGRGSTSKAIKAYVASIQNLHHQVFDVALFGHFHTAEDYTAGNTRIFMNGCWPGGDDYSINQLGLASPPRQWAFGLSPSRGVTWQYQLELALRREATPPSRSDW